MRLRAIFILFIMTQTISADTSAIVAELGGQSSNEVSVMIGIGLVKDSDAVYFQYVGDDKTQALVKDNGTPLTRISPVRFTGVSIADDVYQGSGFSGNKLNVFFETQQQRVVMLTAGLTTIWSQCILGGLLGLVRDGSLDSLVAVDTWKGNSKMKPCFAGIRNNGIKVTDESLKSSLNDARADRDYQKVEKILRDTVEILAVAVDTKAVEVTVEQPISNRELAVVAGDF